MEVFNNGDTIGISNIMSSMKTAAEKMIPIKEKKPDSWFAVNEEELKPVLEAQIRARHAYSENKSTESKAELKRTSKLVRKTIQKAKDK
jgi:uncharacterized protein YdaT